MRGVSVIICCYNSAKKLPQTLKHLADQQVDSNVEWELIIVNNNSKDQTVAVVQEEWAKYTSSVTCTIVNESKPGLSFAREAGVNKARYDILIFCDDDNWLNSNYVQTAYGIMQDNSYFGIVGGNNTAVAESDFPSWFEELKSEYACGTQGDKDGVTKRFYIWGAGMVIRKKIFEELKEKQFTSQLSDRKGVELSSGGDSEICFGAILLGYELAYSSKLQLKHFMSSDRLQWSYVVRLMLGHAKASYKLAYYWDLLDNRNYDKKWSTSLFKRSKMFLEKEGVYSIYHYLKSHKKVTDKFSLSYMVRLQSWVEHMEMYDKYDDFINYLENLKKIRVKK
ncbi:glycosyltransferase [Hymenobacter crusticola]|uniref:Glycosyltransferase 2-like domain-containing protein n=1 Tax=Hymenobacter crusticola TaxID=1770526 RepID=A0A243WBY9_9BACT|nr:glycosyltransferase [Hymenobacter crusticola]OUJ73152.1 hypothetical protein BXP70_15095 [Hymenobacter crusticola]